MMGVKQVTLAYRYCLRTVVVMFAWYGNKHIENRYCKNTENGKKKSAPSRMNILHQSKLYEDDRIAYHYNYPRHET